jgi:hypothetical protein
MGKFRSKIKKVMMALAVNHGEIYLLNTRQQWSEQFQKPLTVLTLQKRMTRAEWNAIHPNKPTDKDFRNDNVLETFKEIDILLYLVEQLKSGEMNGT